MAGDKWYDTAGFVAACRKLGITPHVAQSIKRAGGSAIDARTTRHRGYLVSRRLRKRIEEILGWSKDGRAAQDARPRTAECGIHGDTYDRLRQHVAARQASARSGTGVGHVSMESGPSTQKRPDHLAQPAGIDLPHPERLRK